MLLPNIIVAVRFSIDKTTTGVDLMLTLLTMSLRPLHFGFEQVPHLTLGTRQGVPETWSFLRNRTLRSPISLSSYHYFGFRGRVGMRVSVPTLVSFGSMVQNSGYDCQSGRQGQPGTLMTSWRRCVTGAKKAGAFRDSNPNSVSTGCPRALWRHHTDSFAQAKGA